MPFHFLANRIFAEDKARDAHRDKQQGGNGKNGVVGQRGAEPHRAVIAERADRFPTNAPAITQRRSISIRHWLCRLRTSCQTPHAWGEHRCPSARGVLQGLIMAHCTMRRGAAVSAAASVGGTGELESSTRLRSVEGPDRSGTLERRTPGRGLEPASTSGRRTVLDKAGALQGRDGEAT